MHAVILAGGKGTRLHPVTLDIPKPLITVQRKPIVNHLLSLFQKHGIKDATLLINKLHCADYEAWQKQHAPDVRLAVEQKPLGTFGGMKQLQSRLTRTFLLSNGDELKDFNLRDLIKFHKQQGVLGTIALFQVPNPSEYGVPVLEGRRIKQFLEKPKNPPSNYISSGLYILEPEVFRYADWKKGFLMIEKDIFPKLAKAGKLAGYKTKGGRWYDCGTFSRWEKAIREW